MGYREEGEMSEDRLGETGGGEVGLLRGASEEGVLIGQTLLAI